jgi:hypothetical protein
MIAWFLGSRVGRYIVAGLAVAAAVAVAALKLISAGREQERAARTIGKLTAISRKKTSDEKVDAMGAGDRKRELDGWLRDDR